MPFGVLFAGLVIGGLFPWYGWSVATGSGSAHWSAGAGWATTGLLIAFCLLTRRRRSRPIGIAGAALLIAEGLRQVLTRGEIIDHVLVVAGLSALIGLVLPATGRNPLPTPTAPAPRGYASTILAVAGVGALVANFALETRLVSPVDAARGTPDPRRSEFRRAASDSGRTEVVPASGEPAPGGVPRPVPGAAPDRSKIAWASFSQGMADAKSRRLPMFVQFYATWCGACRSMDRDAFRDAGVARKLREIVAVRVNAEETIARDGLKGVDLARRFRVEAYPTLLVIDSQGKELARLVGAPDAAGFLRWLDGAIAGAPKAGPDSRNRTVRVANNQ